MYIKLSLQDCTQQLQRDQENKITVQIITILNPVILNDMFQIQI